MSYQGNRFGYAEKADASRVGKKRSGWNPNWKKNANPVARGSAYKAIATPSAQQCDIFAHFACEKPLVVRALAGTGKTATVVDGMNRNIPHGKSVCYIIFANRNAREAESKTPERIKVTTCHAFGLSITKSALGKVEVDAKGEKARNIAQALLGPEDEKLELRYSFCKGMSLAKGALAETTEQIIALCDKYEIEIPGMNEEEFAHKVLEGMELCAKQWQRVDFDDMLWLPWKLKMNVPTFDYVIADEMQDLNAVRRWIVLQACRAGKLVGIGDENQAIFGFTGADSESMAYMVEATGADILPLTTTYRCGKAIVRLAQKMVPDYVAADSNPEGEVVDRTSADMQKPCEEGGAGAGDFVLSRVNAPLVSLCLQFVKQGRKACVLGRDLGTNLTYMIKRSGAASVDGFLMWLDSWQGMECERLTARNKPCEHIIDKADCLRALCEGTNDLTVVKNRITDMFEAEDKVGEGPSRIILSTVHKAKGLEADRVWLLNYTFKCQGPDEGNVYYVAVTRARTSLYMVAK